MTEEERHQTINYIIDGFIELGYDLSDEADKQKIRSLIASVLSQKPFDVSLDSPQVIGG